MRKVATHPTRPRPQVNARGYPCAKGCNSSASQWLSGEQVRLCLGHPKVHFGTIVEGSSGGGGGGGARVLRAPSLQHFIYLITTTDLFTFML